MMAEKDRKIRLSSYGVFSDSAIGSYFALLNGCSGALDMVPASLSNHFKKLLERSQRGQAYVDRNHIHPEILDSLLEGGHLTSLSHEREKMLIAEIAHGLHEQEKKRPYFMIVPTMDCNYRCIYCFERNLQNRLQSKNSRISYPNQNVVMPEALIRPIYESIKTVQKLSGNETGGMVILYGGEPLDIANQELVFQIVQQGAADNFWFSAVTNGHDLGSFLPLIKDNLLRTIQVTIDGPKTVHDRRRLYRGKGSSFDAIIGNVDRVLSIPDVEVHIRVHLDANSIGQFEEVVEFFQHLGWTNNESVIIYASVLYEKDISGQVNLKMDSADAALRISRASAGFFNVFTSAQAVHVARALEIVFESGDRYPLRGTYCSANFGNHIFAPDGGVYACWESVGQESACIGRFAGDQGLVLNPKATARWFARNIALIDECLECELALICGGGCAQYALYNKGSLNKSYCNDFQRIFKAALTEEVYRRLSFAGFQAGAKGDREAKRDLLFN